jgi:YD repeat-containing protein
MMYRTLTSIVAVFFVWMALCLAAPVLVSADQAQYIYDDLGRLTKVIDGQGNVATYNYDAVGNLLSITRSTGGVGAPTVTGLTPIRERACLRGVLNGGQ